MRPSIVLDFATNASYVVPGTSQGMGMAGRIDPELTALIEEVIEADLLKRNSSELRIAHRVAVEGLAALEPGEVAVFEAKVLPILAKPLRDQVAIASILRRGGYVPRKIEY